MGYENESTNWEWTDVENPQIRFAGIDEDANALEVAIYKGSYLENLEYGTAYELCVDMWDENGSRTVDDTDNAPSFVLRPTWQTDPDIYESLLIIPHLYSRRYRRGQFRMAGGDPLVHRSVRRNRRLSGKQYGTLIQSVSHRMRILYMRF